MKTFSTTVCPTASYYGNCVSCNGNRCIWTMPRTLSLCLYIISCCHFHSPFSHRNTFRSPTYLTSIPFSFCLSHTNILYLSSAHVSLHLPQCKRLVSWQVLRPIKLSTSLADLKDTNTQSALRQCTQTDSHEVNMC